MQSPRPAAALLAIAARASRLDERLAGRCHPDPSADPTEAGATATRRLEQWARTLSREGEIRPRAVLARRLAWDGLESETLPAALGPVAWADPKRPPAWLRFFADVLEAAAGFGENRPAPEIFAPFTPGAGAWERTPFVELWQPFLAVACERLRARAGAGLQWLAPAAAAAFAEDLLRQFGALGAPAGYEAFERFRAAQNAPAQQDSREVHRAFTAALLPGGMPDFFADHPALARQLCLRAESWAANLTRLLARLDADAAELADIFHHGRPLGEIRAIRPGLSDRHHGGQQVAALEFRGGLKLIYKPKPLDQEAAFQNLVRWLSARPDAPPLPPALRVLPREGYGWVECVEPSPCAAPAEVARYYRRAGGLLCLLHALGGNDCHRDNVFATREGPLLIDIESLLQPRWNPVTGAAAGGGANSVLATGLLPMWQKGTDGEYADVSGLRGQGGELTRLRRRVWRAVNTDAMHAAEEPVATTTTPNLPQLDGQPQFPEDHAAELLAGFEESYRFLLRERDALAAAGGPLATLGKVNPRLICRPSNLYAKLLRALGNDARYSGDGFERSVAIEALVRPLLAAPERPPLWSLLAAERAALEDGDVPFFTVRQVAEALGVEPARFAPDFAARLAGLDENDLARQTEFIRAALLRPAGNTASAEPAALTRAIAAVPTDLRPLTDAEFTAEATRLADEIAARANADASGASWLSPDALRPGENGGHGAPFYLYGGATGVALFLAALERVAGGGRHRELIAAACRPIRTLLDLPYFGHWTEREPLGAGVGLGGVVYGLVKIGELLGDSAYLETAARVARWMLPERIAADRTFDVVGGTAGALLGLLALHRATGEGFALELAARCGQHLCANARPGPNGGRAWATGRGGARLAGFAHGAAGIACALARLHAATGGGEPEFLETARAAAAYERTVFLPEAGNWPVLAPPDAPPREPLLLSTWCHGAPGIALARIGGLTALDDADVRRDLDLALRGLVAGGLTLVDHLCCGNLGRVGIAGEAARVLKQPALGTLARAAASYVVGQAAGRGGAYRLRADETEDRFFEAGFFRGASGIGYELLRLAHPERLPCVLSFA